MTFRRNIGGRFCNHAICARRRICISRWDSAKCCRTLSRAIFCGGRHGATMCALRRLSLPGGQRSDYDVAVLLSAALRIHHRHSQKKQRTCIHADKCPLARGGERRSSEKWIETTWSDKADQATYRSAIAMECRNRPGWHRRFLRR